MKLTTMYVVTSVNPRGGRESTHYSDLDEAKEAAKKMAVRNETAEIYSFLYVEGSYTKLFNVTVEAVIKEII